MNRDKPFRPGEALAAQAEREERRAKARAREERRARRDLKGDEWLGEELNFRDTYLGSWDLETLEDPYEDPHKAFADRMTSSYDRELDMSKRDREQEKAEFLRAYGPNGDLGRLESLEQSVRRGPDQLSAKEWELLGALFNFMGNPPQPEPRTMMEIQREFELLMANSERLLNHFK